jgi:type IX secretion system PorP/SprF family membrane protein
MGYQPGLTNLGNPDIMLPQSSILGMNPGFAGGSLSPRFEMNYRNQWWGSNMNSQSLNMSFDNYSQSLRGGYGVMISAQDFGMGGYTDVNMSAFYSPKIVLGKHFTLEPAVKVTLGAMSVNAEKMSSISQLEINRGHSINMSGAAMANGVGRLWYKDYGLGLMLNSKWFFAGFSADNLAGHYENVYTGDGFEPSRMPTRISAILGTDIEREHKKNFTLSPFVAYEKFDQRNEIWAGFNYRLKWVTVGGSISNNLDFTASAGVKFEKFRLIYRYDRTQSQLLSSPAASHNIGIRINGDVIRKGSLRK